MINVNVTEELSLPYFDELWLKKRTVRELYSEELVFGVRFRTKRDYSRTTIMKFSSGEIDMMNLLSEEIDRTFVSFGSASKREYFNAYCFEEDRVFQIPLWDATLVYYGI